MWANCGINTSASLFRFGSNHAASLPLAFNAFLIWRFNGRRVAADWSKTELDPYTMADGKKKLVDTNVLVYISICFRQLIIPGIEHLIDNRSINSIRVISLLTLKMTLKTGMHYDIISVAYLMQSKSDTWFLPLYHSCSTYSSLSTMNGVLESDMNGRSFCSCGIHLISNPSRSCLFCHRDVLIHNQKSGRSFKAFVQKLMSWILTKQ